MAETRKSVSDLTTLLADNVAGDISPQDLRDLMISALGIYGGIACFEASVTQVEPFTGAKLTCFDTNLKSNGVTADHTGDDLTITIDGDYDVYFQCSAYTDVASEGRFRLYVDAVEQDYGCVHDFAASSAVSSVSFIAPGITLANTDVLTVYVELEGSGDDITVIDAQFTARMVG